MSILDAAVMVRHVDIVRILLDTGVAAFWENGIYSESLELAAMTGSKEVIQLLLDHRVGIDEGPLRVYDLASEEAVIYGYGGMMAFPLKDTTTVIATTFHRVVTSRRADMLRFLRDHGVNINNETLYLAMVIGLEGIIRTLLKEGANVDLGTPYASVYQASVGPDHLLLRAPSQESYLDPRPSREPYYNPVLRIWKILKSILQIWIERVVNDGSPSLASFMLGEMVVQKLIDASAVVHQLRGHYGNALQLTAVGDRLRIVEMLLKAGAYVDTQRGVQGNPLQAALLRGSGIAWELLEDELPLEELPKNKLRRYEVRQDGLAGNEESEDDFLEDECRRMSYRRRNCPTMSSQEKGFQEIRFHDGSPEHEVTEYELSEGNN